MWGLPLVGLPADYSEHGWRYDRALTITQIFVLVLFIVVVAWIAAAVISGRKRKAARTAASQGGRAAIIPLAFAAFIFVVVDGHLFVTSTIDSAEMVYAIDEVEEQGDVLRLQINGRQWAWEARYAGVDGRFGTPDDVYATTTFPLPVARPISVQLASSDVVHGFAVPGLRVAVDAIPGRIGHLWFEITKPAQLEVVCGQYCGVSHYRMAGKIIALPAEDFRRWLARESAYAAEMSAARKELPAASKSLFPVFSPVPDVEPRGWGWPWEDGS